MLLATYGLIRLALDQGRVRLGEDQTSSGAYPASFSVGTGFLPRGSGGRCENLSIHLHLVLQSVVIGAVPTCAQGLGHDSAGIPR